MVLGLGEELMIRIEKRENNHDNYPLCVIILVNHSLTLYDYSAF